MDPKSHPKIDIWAIRGPTFEVFGNVLRNAIFFMTSEVCKKSTKNEKSFTFGRPKVSRMIVFGRVGGRGGRPGNLVLLVQGKDFDTGVRHASNSRLKTGSADLKATASAADPS